MYENDYDAAVREDALHNTTARRRATPAWNAPRIADLPIWHLRPGMQLPYQRTGSETVVSAPQHDANWRTEHVLLRNDLTHTTRVLSAPYRQTVFVSAPAWMLSSEYFHATHDTTPHPRTSALQPAGPDHLQAHRAAAFKGARR